jgi:hypothetical protein
MGTWYCSRRRVRSCRVESGLGQQCPPDDRPAEATAEPGRIDGRHYAE